MQQIKPTCIEGSNTILIQVTIQNSPPTIGVRGKSGAAKRRSFTVFPDLYHCLRKLNCEIQIAIQTTTIVKAATPNKFLKIVSGANCSESNPGIAPNIVTIMAIIGVPDGVSFSKILGK